MDTMKIVKGVTSVNNSIKKAKNFATGEGGDDKKETRKASKTVT